MKDIFSAAVSDEVVQRIEQLNPESQPVWGKMDSGQMMAHVNVQYEMAYEREKHPSPNPIMKMILKAFVKNIVVGPKPYKKNSRTAPAFLIADKRDFEAEKTKLISNIRKTQELGRSHFEGMPSPSFGNLTSDEWNTLFYKHLDHHLQQFGV